MSELNTSFVRRQIGASFKYPNEYVTPLVPQDLVGLALRINPKRAHLLVSDVLGKHVPQDPRILAYAGRLLGAMVWNSLEGHKPAEGLSENLSALRFALPSREGIERMPELPNDAEPEVPVAVIGYAETATGLGFLVAEQLRSWYIHSTRFHGNLPAYGKFEESHSHATSHQLIPLETRLLDSDAPIVLVDDEFSTGTTALNTIEELHAIHPHPSYTVAALIDCRSEADKKRMNDFAAKLGVEINVVALAAGEVSVPDDAVEKAKMVIEEYSSPLLAAGEGRAAAKPEIEYIDVSDAVIGHFLSKRGTYIESYLPSLAEYIGGIVGVEEGRTLVLGLEEFLYLPMRVAEELAVAGEPDEHVFFSSTTQSPVAVVNDAGYAVKNGISFQSIQPKGNTATRFAYNIAGESYDRIIIVLEPGTVRDDIENKNGLLEGLHRLAGKIIVVETTAKGDFS